MGAAMKCNDCSVELGEVHKPYCSHADGAGLIVTEDECTPDSQTWWQVIVGLIMAILVAVVITFGIGALLDGIANLIRALS